MGPYYLLWDYILVTITTLANNDLVGSKHIAIIYICNILLVVILENILVTLNLKFKNIIFMEIQLFNCKVLEKSLN